MQVSLLVAVLSNILLCTSGYHNFIADSGMLFYILNAPLETPIYCVLAQS